MLVKLLGYSIRMASNSTEKLRPICFCGPSGSGKSTLLKRLMAEYPNTFAFSVSHTTRKPRPGETNGKEYHFVTREEMMLAIKENQFLESAEFSGNLYGTSKNAVQSVLNSGKVCVLDIDIQGVKNLKKTDLNPIYCFIKPPSLEDLEKRLRGRGTETEESLANRLRTAQVELEYEQNEKNAFDFSIVNDNLDHTYQKLKEFLSSKVSNLKA